MAEGLVLPYLDIPFQHASPRILKAMKRPGSQEKILERIARWREICPELVIRSTFIVGFPGETEEDFQQLLDFLDQAQLDRVGCFMYSAVEGAAANDVTIDDRPGWAARSHADAPEIDGQVYLFADHKALQVGDFVEARIIDSDEYDLYAELP